jgi:hypothetical protein
MRPDPDTTIVAYTLGKVMPQAASSYQRDYRVGSALKSLADDNPGLALSSSGYLFCAVMPCILPGIRASKFPGVIHSSRPRPGRRRRRSSWWR